MSRKTKHKTKVQQPSAARRPLWWLAGAIVVAVAALAGYWMWAEYSAATGQDPLKLMGKWQRPDGGYVLELRGADPDGQLKAAYFNPRSINVSRSRWKQQEGGLQVFIELRDVNYPGSTYTLNYDPATDRLTGIYFQAALQQQFEVHFVRKK